MRFFKDRHGRERAIKLDAFAVHDIQTELGIDITTVEGLDAIDREDSLLVNVLWILTRPHGSQTDTEFGRSLVGAPMFEAKCALCQAVGDFLPTQEQLQESLPTLDADEAAAGDSNFTWYAWCLRAAGGCGVDPRGLSAAELFAMQQARLKEWRQMLVSQSALIWSADELDLSEFIRCGSFGPRPKTRMSPELQAAVHAKMDEVFANGGKLIIEAPIAA